MASQLRIGIGTADITPEIGMPNICYIDAKVNKITSRLMLQVCIIQDGDRNFAVLAADICAFFHESIQDIRNIISETAEIPLQNIYVNASHTHSAPYLHKSVQSFLDAYELKFLDWGYYSSFLEAVRKATLQAVKNKAEVKVKYSSGKVEAVACNRRVKLPDGSIGVRYGRNVPEYLREYPDGLIDDKVECLWFVNAHGQPFGGFVNYACHSTSYNQYDEICWDYPGFAREQIQKQLRCPILFLQGCAGNISPGKYTVSDPLKDSAALGSRLSKAVLEGYTAAKTIHTADSENLNVTLLIEGRIHDSEEELQQKIVEETKKYKKDRQENPGAYLGANLISLAERLLILKNYPEKKIPVEIGVLKLGEAVLAFLPSEIFIQSALEIKKRQPDRPLLVMAYTDNTVQYIPDIPSFEENGGYETGEEWCFCQPGSHESVNAKALELISKR